MSSPYSRTPPGAQAGAAPRRKAPTVQLRLQIALDPGVEDFVLGLSCVALYASVGRTSLTRRSLAIRPQESLRSKRSGCRFVSRKHPRSRAPASRFGPASQTGAETHFCLAFERFSENRVFEPEIFLAVQDVEPRTVKRGNGGQRRSFSEPGKPAL